MKKTLVLMAAAFVIAGGFWAASRAQTTAYSADIITAYETCKDDCYSRVPSCITKMESRGLSHADAVTYCERRRDRCVGKCDDSLAY